MTKFIDFSSQLHALVEDYDRIVLVANNPDVKLAAGNSKLRSLYVLLNKAEPLAKVRQFEEDCIIISGRSSDGVFAIDGDRIPALQRIAPGRCKAVAVLAAEALEKPKLRNWDGAWINLGLRTSWPYPPGKPKSTGFIALNHLVQCAGQREVNLLGFNGRSSTRRSLPAARHDWVYEQLYIRLLAESGRITLDKGDNFTRDRVELLRRAFPELGSDQFQRVLHSYAAEELSYFKGAVHGIIKILRPITFFRKSLHFG